MLKKDKVVASLTWKQKLAMVARLWAKLTKISKFPIQFEYFGHNDIDADLTPFKEKLAGARGPGPRAMGHRNSML